jgi:ribonucleoside-diphosphate reductase alpha chain
MSNIYDRLSEERKKLQSQGLVPDWWSTGGFQLFKDKYLYQADNPKEQYERIAATLAVHTPDPDKWKVKFFDLMWKGWLSPSTPVLANTGTQRGLPVSCAGSYVGDSISDIYSAKHETAMLTKMGFGTAGYLGDVRPRGSNISVGGTSTGVLPIIEGFQKDMEYVAQGTARRGSWAAYLPIDHGDFYEVCSYLETEPDGNNVGWCVSDAFIEALENGDKEAVSRYQTALRTKMITGKGYFFFNDKANAKRPQWYVDNSLDVKAPQLCVAPETLILTDKGYEVISELQDQSVNVWNGSEWSNVVVRKTGENQKLVKVKVDSGQELECTEYHKFYVNVRDKGVVEKRANELAAGDRLVKFEAPIINGTEELENAYQNGFYTGDGCAVTTKGRFEGCRIYLYGEKKNLLSEFDQSKIRQFTNQVNLDRMYFYYEGLKDKFFVPDADYTVGSRVAWLSGYLDADGTVARCGKSQCLQVACIEEGFLEQVQLMLQTLGVQSKVVNAREEGSYLLPANDGSGELKEFDCKETKRLLISGMGIVKLKSLGLDCKRLKITDHVPNRNAERFPKVVEVIDEGRYDDTYCFSEPLRHMGVFNGLLTGQCNEIMLHSGPDYTYTCVLASMNLKFWDEWKDTDAVFESIVFLDCVVQEFIERGKNVPGLEKAIAATKKGRALGLGVCGLHTLFQQKGMPFGGLDSVLLNIDVFKHIRSDAEKATKWVSEQWGEPEWCKGYGRANTHLLAVAPTKSTALIMGGVSEGINPDTAMVYTQRTPAGEIDRVNPILLDLMKERGVYSKRNISDIRDSMGSVQHVDWLTDEEKDVFRTAFEIDQKSILSMASSRAKYIDQWQSLNLFFSAEEEESYISEVHKQAFLDPNILGLYYVYSKAGIQASKDECMACQ